MGDVGRIEGDRIADIGVLVGVVPLELPCAGNSYVVECRPLVGLVPKAGDVPDAGVVPEAPPSVEELEAFRLLPIHHVVCGGCGIGDVIGARGQGVLMEDGEILEVASDMHQ